MERSILNNLKTLCKKESMTIILISRRLRTLRICDEIFFIENGSLEANGNFANYMKNQKISRSSIDP